MKLEILNHTLNAEKTIEEAGRTCYQSNDRITEDSHVGFIKGLINAGHTSVLEHASITFKANGISRSLMSQITRHRIASYSIQSQRYNSYANKLNNNFNEKYFDYIDCKEKAYILGFLFADGNIYINKKSGHYVISIKLKKDDDYLLYKIQNLIGKKTKIFYYEEENTVKLSFGSKYMANILIDKYGLMPKKSFTKRAKKAFKNIDKKFHKNFILGYFDGNGTVGRAKRSESDVFAGIYCYSLEFIQDVINNIPFFSKNSKPSINKIIFQGKNKVFKFLDYLYEDIDFEKDMFLIRKFCKSIFISYDFYNKYKNKLDNNYFIIPKEIKNKKETFSKYIEVVKGLFESYFILLRNDIKKEDARFILPISTTTEITFTMNFRSLRNFFELRLEKHAQWEIRDMAKKMLIECKKIAPSCFFDFDENGRIKKRKNYIDIKINEKNMNKIEKMIDERIADYKKNCSKKQLPSPPPLKKEY
jgi:thymidylate synthase (FAD)